MGPAGALYPEALKVPAAAGTPWVRIPIFWRGVQWLGPDFWNWSQSDSEIDALASRGFNILVTFNSIPPWANGDPVDCDWLEGECTHPPTDADFFATFVAAAVNRYKNRVQHWEIWNEPEYHAFWNGTLSEFMDLVAEPGIAALRSADPLAVVMGPSTFNGLSKFQDFLTPMCALVDKASVHFYVGGSATMYSQLDSNFLPWMATNCNKPLWITETGLESTAVGEASQAQNYVAAYAGTQTRAAVEKLFIFNWVDGLGYGIVEEEARFFRPKRAFFEIQDFTNSLLGLPNNLVIRDTLANNSTVREVGDSLSGTTTEVGAKTWSANSTFVFGLSEVTTSSGGDAAHVGGVPFNPSVDPAKPVQVVETDFILTGTILSSVGFSLSATGGYWGDGQIWAHISPGGDFAVYANGLTHLLAVGEVPGFHSDRLNNVRLHYQRAQNLLRVFLNDQLVLDWVDLDTLSFTPSLAFAGIHIQTASGSGAGTATFDNFRVFSEPDTLILVDHFETGELESWWSTCPPNCDGGEALDRF